MCSKEPKIIKVSPRTSAANIRGKSLHPGLCVGSSSSVFAETYASSSRSSKSFLLPVYYNTKTSVRIHKNHEFLSNAYHIKMTIITRKSFWKSKNRYSYQHHYGTHDEEVDPPRPNPARVNRCQVQTVKLNTLICYKIFWRPNNIFIAMWTLSRFGHNEIKKITYSSGSTLSKSV